MFARGTHGTGVIREAQLTRLQISSPVLQKLDMNGAVRPCANKPYCSSYLGGRAISLSNPNADSNYCDLPIDPSATHIWIFNVFKYLASQAGSSTSSNGSDFFIL